MRFKTILAINVLLFGARLFANSPQNPDLTGTVFDENDAPLADASVFIYTAGPRTGTSTYCPSCYADCRKHATTIADGHFKIESLSSNLLFRVLITAKDHKPQFESKVDPTAGPLNVVLAKLDRSKVGPKQKLSGKVTDPAGNPIFGATVNFDFFFGEEANCGGGCEGVDPLAVTDRDGNFTITADKKFDWMTVSVEARGFARRKFFQLSSTNEHNLRLTEGANVTGRLVRGGKPVADVEIGLVSVDRSDDFTGEFVIGTGLDGKFLLPNIPPYQQYVVYAKMESARDLGCVAVKRIRVAADGTIKDIGDLSLLSGYQLTGHVVLSDGKPVPPHTRMLIDRRLAWDTQTVEIGADGSFTAVGLPPETYDVSLRIPGYMMSSKNVSLDRLNGGSLIGLVEKDTDLKILLEPGEFQRPDFEARRRPEKSPGEQPLQGVPNEQ